MDSDSNIGGDISLLTLTMMLRKYIFENLEAAGADIGIGDPVVEKERKKDRKTKMKEDKTDWPIGFYLVIIWFHRELLTDPNEGMTDREIRLGKQVRKVKVSQSCRSGRQNTKDEDI